MSHVYIALNGSSTTWQPEPADRPRLEQYSWSPPTEPGCIHIVLYNIDNTHLTYYKYYYHVMIVIVIIIIIINTCVCMYVYIYIYNINNINNIYIYVNNIYIYIYIYTHTH